MSVLHRMAERSKPRSALGPQECHSTGKPNTATLTYLFRAGGSKICIGLAMSMFIGPKINMSICACYPPALLFPDYFQGALHRSVSLCRLGSPYTPLEDKENVEAGNMPLSKFGTIRSAETGCPEVETSKLRRARFSVLSKC